MDRPNSCERSTSTLNLSDDQRLFAFVPVARAQFIALQGIKYPQNFIRIASHRSVGHVHEANNVVRVDEVGRSLRHARGWINNSKLLAEIVPDVRQHGER